MLVDRYGRALRRKKQMANLVIYRSLTGEAPWTPVMREEVPDKVKEPDVIGNLLNGEMCKVDGDKHWYRAEKVAAERVSPTAVGLH